MIMSPISESVSCPLRPLVEGLRSKSMTEWPLSGAQAKSMAEEFPLSETEIGLISFGLVA